MTKLVVVDMDGCLCALNSYQYWLVFSLFFTLITFKWLILSQLIGSVALRISGKSDRVQMKREVLEATEKLPEYFVSGFSRFLFYFTNADVLAEIQKYVHLPVHIVLNTAAPELYVQKYASFFEFSSVFATPYVNEYDWKENIGDRKLDALLRYYGEGFHLLCVITDHHDDMPLLVKSEKRVLVKPSRKTLDVIEGCLKIDYILD